MARDTEVLGGNLPVVTLPTTDTTELDSGSNMDHHSGKPQIGCLSHGTAYLIMYGLDEGMPVVATNTEGEPAI
jgi:hypothetical protein